MLGAGSMVSQGGRSLIRLVTTGLMLSGLGVAGAGVYGNQISDPRVNQAQAFIQDHAREAIILGVVLVVLGFVLNMLAMRRMQKQMMGGMGLGGMGGRGGAPGMAGMPDLQSMMGQMGGGQPLVKVRCASCGKLQAESAAFCGDCGKPMAVPPPRT